MSKKDIEQTVEFNASTHEVYELLMDENKHAEFTGASANISRKVGGEFSVWGDYATGKNVELIPDKKIVQTWRASDWPDNAISTVTFKLNSKDGSCELRFSQSGIPKDFVKDISKGWEDNYWKLMQKYLSSH